MVFRVAFLLLIGLISSGCVTPTEEITMTFSEEEFGAYRGDGDATVFGQAFLRQRGGGVVVCAGEPVVLFPRTPSFERAIGLARQRVRPVFSEAADPRFKEVARAATCDAQGNFRFVNLPRARWYVMSRVQWTVGDFNYQGGELLSEIDTTDGGEHQVLLTDAQRL